MITFSNINSPEFAVLPTNNNRTAWRPFGYPVILCVPRRRNLSGEEIIGSNVFGVRVYVQEVPQIARVAGHDNIGITFPSTELYAYNVDAVELAERLINLNDYSISEGSNNYFSYISRTGIRSDIQIIEGADYYDLTDIQIDFELLPSGHYFLSYEAKYYSRVTAGTEEDFLCVDDTNISVANKVEIVNHPGEVIEEFTRLTPSVYLTNATRALDTTIGFYRPFTDVIQDSYDEATLLSKINWIYDITPQAIPYLSSLLGWDIPYFPASLDALRRAVLRRTVEFQNLKGSRKAIIELFRLFGYEILLINLWYSEDGKRFIRPGESLPDAYKADQIDILQSFQIDPLYAAQPTGFVESSISLTYRPQITAGLGDFKALRDGGDVTIRAYSVPINSSDDLKLSQLVNDISSNPRYFANTGAYYVDLDGFYQHTAILDLDLSQDIISSQILLQGKLGQPTKIINSAGDLFKNNISLDRDSNLLSISLAPNDNRIYIFALYEKQLLDIPVQLQNLQSNHFDIQVLTDSLTEVADPTTLEFTIEFINRLKSFHSILRTINSSFDTTEVYNVTDFCVGGDATQRYNTDAGQLQVPPAILPNVPTDASKCIGFDPQSLGYKPEDLLLRSRVINGLYQEFDASMSLDGRSDINNEATRLAPLFAIGEFGSYLRYAQNRVYEDPSPILEYLLDPTNNSNSHLQGEQLTFKLGSNDLQDQQSSTNRYSGLSLLLANEKDSNRQSLTTLDGRDYCYQGRVADQLLHNIQVPQSDSISYGACELRLGLGQYYTYPVTPIAIRRGVGALSQSSKSSKTILSGQAPDRNRYYDTGLQGALINLNVSDSLLSSLYRAYKTDGESTLHYINTEDVDINQRQYLALSRPSLEIQKSHLHFPGCRFLKLNALSNDYVNNLYQARPWDFDFVCGPEKYCSQEEIRPLNYKIVEENGNQHLVFDDASNSYQGNGLVQDFNSLGDHTSSISSQNFIHSVYMGGAGDSPYVILDEVCDYGTAGPIIEIEQPLFRSHSNCGTYLNDYADGYGCSSGEVEVLAQSYDYLDALEGIGFPSQDITGASAVAKLCTGVLEYEQSYRLDCGCLVVDCDPTLETDAICSLGIYANNSSFNFEQDMLDTPISIELPEFIGISDNYLDGSIESLLETI